VIAVPAPAISANSINNGIRSDDVARPRLRTY
jgi:hypothetical protein